jgi:hypothetical protein
VLNPDTSPHANRLARPPCFPEVFEEDEDVLEDYRFQKPNTRDMPQEAALYAVCLATPRVGTPLVVPPSLLQAPIVATIQVDIDESLLKQNKKRMSRRSYHRQQQQLKLWIY